MRIRAGSLKGRLLKSPRGEKIRPTSDKVKMAFFNIIGDCLKDVNFLDLFSGTGSIGLEALSRGAGRSIFVEKNRLSLEILRENIKLTGTQDRAQVLPLDIFGALKLLSKKGESFEIIYLDPPYDYQGTAKVLQYLYREDLVKEGGIISLERSGRDGRDGLEKVPFRPWKKKVYGNVFLLIFKKEYISTLDEVNLH
jgi:16S rRNA (guanine966-N2)-methyltransferase